MNLIDFLIGLTLMNAMPHYILGTWKQRMISAFGFGDQANIAYGLLNYAVSISLFLYQYGAGQLLENGIYAGASSVFLIYFLTGPFWRRLFQKENVEEKKKAKV